LVPCPWIVEAWTPPATAPGRRQPAPAASSARGRRGGPTPRARSQPRPATSTTENTTIGRSRRRSSQARPRARTRSTKMHKVIAGNPVQRLKQPSRRSARSCGISITGSGGRHGPRPRGGTLRPGGAYLEALHSAAIGARSVIGRPYMGDGQGRLSGNERTGDVRSTSSASVSMSHSCPQVCDVGVAGGDGCLPQR
jgi:hypothetical protein